MCNFWRKKPFSVLSVVVEGCGALCDFSYGFTYDLAHFIGHEAGDREAHGNAVGIGQSQRFGEPGHGSIAFSQQVQGFTAGNQSPAALARRLALVPQSEFAR
jgi:hypothetical protein